MYRIIVERATHVRSCLGVVVVTRVASPAGVVEITDAIGATFVQLHNRTWTGSTIADFRRLWTALGRHRISVIAVSTPDDSRERRADLVRHSDLVLIDRQHYSAGETVQGSLAPEAYAAAVDQVRDSGKLVLVAGGLTPENVASYVSQLNPDGVDVQTGVEVKGRPGEKDRERLQAFISALETAR